MFLEGQQWSDSTNDTSEIDVSDMQRYDPAIRKDRNVLQEETGGTTTMRITDIQKKMEGDGIWEALRRRAIHL